MKRCYLVLLLVTALGAESIAQSCSVGNNNSNFRFYTNGCSGGPTYTGNYTIQIGNNSTFKIDGNLTINGTLTIDFQSNDGIFEVMSGFTLTATNMTFTGNPTAKNFIANGTVTVTNTLNFGGKNIDIDGTGSITAGSVTGGGTVTCSSDGSCPTFTAGSCTGGGVCSGQGLPITLSSFSAKAESSAIAISWTTQSELNFDYFDLERSSDGKDFFAIGRIAGSGNSTEKRTYKWSDEKPLIGKNYYRLKSVDFDGYTEYFKVVAIEFNSQRNFLVYPNPSDGMSLGYELNFAPNGTSTIVILDNFSNVIGVYQPSGYSQNIQFANALKGGVYYAKFMVNDFVKVERFVVK